MCYTVTPVIYETLLPSLCGDFNDGCIPLGVVLNETAYIFACLPENGAYKSSIIYFWFMLALLNESICYLNSKL